MLIDCGVLPIPQHGKKTEETKTTYLGRVTFQCTKKGFELKGSQQRVCQQNGKWNGTLTKCEPVECNDPGMPRFGGRNPNIQKYRYESKLEYTCQTSHTLQGDKSIICQYDRTWNGSVPKCLRPCTDPGIPRGGRRHAHSFLHGDKVTFSCINGWKMEGERTITCKNGKWNYKAPRCLGKCDDPGSPYNGWRNGNEFFEGKRVTFKCNRDHDLIGQQTLQCLNTGRWNGQVPECKRRCIYQRPSHHSTTISNTANGQSLKHGTTITHSCANDYTLVGQKTVWCDNGQWNPSIPQCKAPCQDPGPIDNGKQIGRTITHRSVVRYACNNGFTLDGASQLICNDGRWSKSVPSCKESCNDPGTPRNGERNGDDFKHGSRVSYVCRENTQLVGTSWATCSDGKWSSQAPKCLEKCSTPKRLLNGNTRVHRIPPLSGDKVTFSCNPHYDLVGSKVITCQSGAWNDSVPRCAGRCKLPNNINNLQASINLKNGDWIQNGTKIIFSCKPDHKLEGKKKVTCKDGQWSRNFPKCKDCVMVGSRVLGRWWPIPAGGYMYYKSYVKTIDKKYNEVQVELEDINQYDDKFKILRNTQIVLDVPNKQLDLPIGTRVLAPWENKYYTGTITYTQSNYGYYKVSGDDSSIQWLKKNKIRVLKPTSFCEE